MIVLLVLGGVYSFGEGYSGLLVNYIVKRLNTKINVNMLDARHLACVDKHYQINNIEDS
jgi:hypothetical protein